MSWGGGSGSTQTFNIDKYCEIPAFRRDAHQTGALLGFRAEKSGNYVLTFRDNLMVIFLTLEDGTDRFVPKIR